MVRTRQGKKGTQYMHKTTQMEKNVQRTKVKKQLELGACTRYTGRVTVICFSRSHS